ncbi:DNA-directed RNA polymerase subunit A' [Candidatus Woesearchaeota archaeon]|jgi:DNA-directed RNA polymerase subunit A'|nr:DNA-directed RNA polymerase subunit A' [Candidatus Woesearchaeota archaeon]MBT4321612.1 DNA-directed RNA polymerase subunit A' [Candidatus Woesearchaeota archaeon]MBT4631077.1 DNA-directed RNA polymerase subunit A' [Candidatus Woesearchaeota archaeon]
MVEYAEKKIDSISFGLFSPQEIKKISVTKIITPELYDREGYPVDGGLMDIRMGVIDPGLRCKTCSQKLKECPGHFGFMDLARPVIHINYMDRILDLLRISCRECGRFVLDDEKIQIHLKKLEVAEREKRTKDKRKIVREMVAKLKLAKKCSHCNAKQHKITLEKPSIVLEDSKRLTPTEIRGRLERIPDSDIICIGMNPAVARPEWMVLNVLPVPPVTIRPSITLESGERSEDDLTHKLSDIVRINQRLFENINAGAPEIIIEDLWDLLQYHITTFFDNAVAQLPVARHRSGQPLKTLTERIKSKEGRFRHNLAGKRVNYSARTVISPDPKIKFNEVGIPKSVAMELTIPEKVTEWNIDWLKEFIKKGPTMYPGANYVIRPDGKKKKITEDIVDVLLEELQSGYIVERHLMDGDISIFNRQPSLHRMSIMAHKIRILPGRSFRLNPAVCTPYNADFDGDEMNLHLPQTEEARAEAEILMIVQKHIISPKNGMNIIGSIEDAISGIYLLTKDVEFVKSKAVQLLISIGIFEKEKFSKFKENVSGSEIFSALLPEGIDFVGKSKDGESVIIKNSLLKKGTIDKVSIGEENGALIRSIYSKYGDEVGINFMSKVFKLGIVTLLELGFTTSISDSDLPPKVLEKNKKEVESAYKKVDELIQEYEGGKLEALPGNTIDETLEIRIVEVLNNVRNNIGKNVNSGIDEENNNSITMARSGAKGNMLNLSMMAACVGQQSMGGKRIKGGYRGRTLSLFKKGDIRPESKGFVDKGYKSGMKPTEYFFSAMTGRDALMDTALRTPKSGYLYRRLSSALQDLRIEYDGTVRDAEKTIIQFKYGDDGIDVAKSDGGTVNIKKIISQIKGK